MKSENIILELVDRLKKQYHPQKIVLFGSYAYGNPHKDSDIDLLVIKETTDRPIDRRLAVSKILSDPKRFTPLEVIVLTPEEAHNRLEIGDQFLNEILIKGKVLYEQ